MSAEITAGGTLSIPARNYGQCVIRRSERVHVRNIIIEEEYTKLVNATVTKRKTILSGKRKVIDGKHIFTTPEILTGFTNADKKTKKRKTTGAKR